MDQDRIRNFCIIAHIDHGKSTLADRFLELTGTVEKRKMKEQLLDRMDLERERGITIKLQPVRMAYQSGEKRYQLNLIDTPGHVDFSYEVNRSLAACEGAVLLVDASQGIQAQTLANVNLALSHKLKIVPVVNKIDLPNAQPEETAHEIKEAFGFTDDKIFFISAKTGEGVSEVLEALVKQIPPPSGAVDQPLKALIFDSEYDKHRGVIVYVRIVSGKVRTTEELLIMGSATEAEAVELGHFAPELSPDELLSAGEVGYIVTGLRGVEEARVGDTVTGQENPAEIALLGYKEIKPMVFASLFPSSGDDYPLLRDAMEKLKLNDASLAFEPINVPSLGFGFRCGFLGLLHMDIVQERLSREFDLDLVLTAPSVSYEVQKTDGSKQVIYAPAEMANPSEIEAVLEPWVKLDIITPEDRMGPVMELAQQRRGEYLSTTYLGPGRLTLHFEIPLSDVISDFYDKLKSISSGFASMNYEVFGFREGDLVKVDMLVAGDQVGALSFITDRSRAEKEGRSLVKGLKELIPKQQFAVALQAVVGGKVIARETIPALKKDVTAKLYGGDVSRKKKLLEKQKAGKKRLKKVGRVEIPQKAFLALMKR